MLGSGVGRLLARLGAAGDLDDAQGQRMDGGTDGDGEGDGLGEQMF